MGYLWEGDLHQQISQRQNFWRQKELIDGDLINCEEVINPAFTAYYQELQKEAQALIAQQNAEAVGGSLKLMDIDARLSFLINELALEPQKDLAQFKKDEALYYLTDYVKLEFTNDKTLLNQFLNQESQTELVRE